jgi:hypothetical protein
VVREKGRKIKKEKVVKGRKGRRAYRHKLT